jgi:L-asparaginase/Glu-tRNA(Gln) amidotransferase subunit D
VVILAAEGTISGARAESMESEAYKASKVSIDDLVGGIHKLRQLPMSAAKTYSARFRSVSPRKLWLRLPSAPYKWSNG